MSSPPTQLPTDTWIVATWDDYIQATENSDYQKAKSYYYNGKLRIEMSPLGHDRACDHTFLSYAINLYAALTAINLKGCDNCTYRKTGYQDAQPDLSYYIGEIVDAVPYGTSIVQLDTFPPPTLVIEVANSSLADDKGEKRLLYEDLNVAEYWILDVQNIQMTALAMADGGSHRIRVSQALPGLEISLLEEALRRTRHSSHSEVGAWLLGQFQN